MFRAKRNACLDGAQMSFHLIGNRPTWELHSFRRPRAKLDAELFKPPTHSVRSDVEMLCNLFKGLSVLIELYDQLVIHRGWWVHRPTSYPERDRSATDGSHTRDPRE